MAQNIIKTLVEKLKQKRSNSDLTDLPENDSKKVAVKPLTKNEQEKTRTRTGHLQGGINLSGKPKIIENGKKLK